MLLDTDVRPTELLIETTDDAGNLADWLDDEWWTAALEKWNETPIVVRIAVTPEALFHPVLLYQLEMVRRVSPHWRVIGETSLNELVSDAAVNQAAASPYHEIRVTDASSSIDRIAPPDSTIPSIESVFGRIRRAQAQLGVSLPVLVRVPADRVRQPIGDPSDPT